MTKSLPLYSLIWVNLVDFFCCEEICLEGLCHLTPIQLCEMSFRMWFSRIQYTDLSHSFPTHKLPVDFPLGIQLQIYSGTFGSYFRLFCINSGG